MNPRISYFYVLSLMVLVGFVSTIPGSFMVEWKSFLHTNPFDNRSPFVDEGLIGIFFSIQTLISVALAIIIGRLSDRTKLRAYLIVGAAFMTLAAYFIINPANIIFLILGFFLMAPGATLLVMVGSTWIVRSFPSNPGPYFGGLNFTFSISAILSSILVANLSHPWGVLYVFVGVGILCFVLITFFKFHDPAPLIENRKKAIPIKSLMSSKVLWGIGIAALAYAGLEGGYINWIVTTVEREVKENPANIALQPPVLWQMWFYIFHTLGRFAFTFLSTKINPRAYLKLSGVLMVPLFVLWMIFPQSLVHLVIIAIAGLICSAIFPIFQIILTKKLPHAMGFGSSWITIFGGVGNFLWPSITGFLILSMSGKTLPLMLLIQAAILALAAIFLVTRRRTNSGAA